MGFIFSKLLDLWKKVIGNRDVRILMLGLDAAGKTTILYQLKMNEFVKTIPTIGFNVETLDYRGLSLKVWDVGGQDKIRILWKQYYQNTDGIIFVIDSVDKNRINEAAEELHKMFLEEELRNCVFLILANKQDVKGAMSSEEITDKLGLYELKNRKWYVQGTSGTTGQGLTDGFNWIAGAI